MEPARFLAALRWRLRLVVTLRGLARLLVLVLALLLVAGLLDWWRHLPAPQRMIILAGTGLAAAALVWRRVLRPWGCSLADPQLAAVVERRCRNLDGRLFSAIDGLALQPSERERLRGLLGAGLLGELVETRPMWRDLGKAGGLLVVLALLVLWAGSQVGTAACRLLLPWAGHDWPRLQSIEARVERPVVPEDEPVVIEARRLRGEAAPLTLHWHESEGANSRAGRTQADGQEGPWRERLSLPTGRYLISLGSGDALPIDLAVQVVRRPRLRAFAIEATPPAYVGAPPLKVSEAGALTVLPGTNLVCRFDLEGTGQGRTVTASLAGRPVAITGEGDQVSCRLTVAGAGELALDISDRFQAEGQAHPVSAQPQPAIRIALATDRPPQVLLAGAEANEAVCPRSSLELRLDAQDDYGLHSMWLEAMSQTPAAQGRPAVDSPVKTLAEGSLDDNPKAATRRHALEVGTLAGEGATLVLVAKAKDRNDVTGPGVGTSRELRLRVVPADELRRELERLIAEARDKVGKSRDHLGAAPAQGEELATAVRQGRGMVRTASDLVVGVLRRWKAANLGAEEQGVLGQADVRLRDQALGGLEKLLSTTSIVRTAVGPVETELSEVERLLASLLRSGSDLRELRDIRKSEAELAQESAAFVREHLGGQLTEADRQRQADLVERQNRLATRLETWQNRLLSDAKPSLKDAQDAVRTDQPAQHLREAARTLEGKDQRTAALDQQQKALTAIDRLLDLMGREQERGELAEAIGELARSQDQLTRSVQSGAELKHAAAEQRRLEDAAKSLQERLKNAGAPPAARDALDAATKAQDQADKAMEGGKRSEAAQESSAAGSLLRQAQSSLQGEDQKKQADKKDDQKNKDQPAKPEDLVALLRQLRDRQGAIVTAATRVRREMEERRQGGPEPERLGFAEARTVKAIAADEETVHLELAGKVMPAVEQQPVVKNALERAGKLAERAWKHLATPALGEEGVTLTRRCLAALDRIVAALESMPPPGGKQDQGNGGKGGGPPPEQAPGLPPPAIIALLTEEQDTLSSLTRAGSPLDLAARQDALGKMAQDLSGGMRPGTRMAQLMDSTVRAMASAGELLAGKDRGQTTRAEQDLAVSALRVLLAELMAQQPSGGGGANQNDSQNNQPQNQPPPDGGGQEKQDPQTTQGNPQSGKNGGNGGQAGSGALVDPTSANAGELMRLPPQFRKAIGEVRPGDLPPGAFQLHKRFLELLVIP